MANIDPPTPTRVATLAPRRWLSRPPATPPRAISSQKAETEIPSWVWLKPRSARTKGAIAPSRKTGIVPTVEALVVAATTRPKLTSAGRNCMRLDPESVTRTV